MTYYNRRSFLKTSAAGFLATAGALSSVAPATASSASGYKAMVCLFLKGGTDMMDVLMPYDQASYDGFAALRPGIMNRADRARENVLALDPLNGGDFGGRRFALAPEVAPLRDMFASGESAIVGSVGPLIEPTTRTGIESNTNAVPKQLFSHNDQQSTWMSLGVEGTLTGWGGRFGDYVRGSASNPQYTTLAASSVDVFLSGRNTRAFRMPKDASKLDIKPLSRTWLTSGSHGEAAREKLQAYLLAENNAQIGLYGRDVQASRGRGIRLQKEYVEAFAGRSLLTTEFPKTKLGAQLRSIANSIHIQSAFGNSRQIFYATIGGFDTHDNQAPDIQEGMTEVAEAIAAFRLAMVEAQRWNDVALFTMSDFGRTLTDNGDGTDHGWGSHHFVFGGAVQGNRIYGEMPELEAGSERFTDRLPRLIPTVSVEQYAATLGRWFGIEEGQLDSVLPNLNRFESRDLGFFGNAIA